MTYMPYIVKGQTFMVIGAAGELPKPPQQPVVFLEGMSHVRTTVRAGPNRLQMQTWTTLNLPKL